MKTEAFVSFFFRHYGKQFLIIEKSSCPFPQISTDSAQNVVSQFFFRPEEVAKMRFVNSIHPNVHHQSTINNISRDEKNEKKKKKKNEKIEPKQE